MQPATIGIREAKTHLSKYLKIIQTGQEIIITDRGRPVGKIVPVQAKDLPSNYQIKQMEERGLIKPSTAGTTKKIPSLISVSNNIAQNFLKEDRNHG